jgi:type I restriction enzyme, S subunit
VSAISWLTDGLPEDWRLATLRDLTSKIGSGATPRGGSAVYLANGVTFIRSQNVHDNEFVREGLAHISDAAARALKGVTVEQGDVLLNITGDSILRCCLVPESALPARVNQHVAIVRSNGLIEPLIVQKFLTTPSMKEFMLGHSSGGTRKAITKAHIESFPVPVPPVPEQIGIVETLRALDRKIESCRRATELAMKLLDAMSVKLGTGLAAVSLRELATVPKRTVNPATLGSRFIDHYSLPAFDSHRLPDHVPAAEVMSNKLQVTFPCVLVSRLNPRINRTWFAVPRDGVTAMASTEFMILEARNAEELGALWLAVRDESFMTELVSRVTGTSGSHQRVRPDDALSICVPDVRELDSAQKAEALALLRCAHQKAIEGEKLASVRDAIVPSLLSGRIRVPEAGHLAGVAS